jgi:hypothetical protein
VREHGRLDFIDALLASLKIARRINEHGEPARRRSHAS